VHNPRLGLFFIAHLSFGCAIMKTSNNLKEKMKKALKEHINYLETILEKEKNDFDWQSLSDYNRVQIGFFQQERLIHLLVTLFFGLIFFEVATIELWLLASSSDWSFLHFGFLLLSEILLIVLVFYIWHYFVLENGVQKLYRLENKITKKIKKEYKLK
jgi:hypothetical protein